MNVKLLPHIILSAINKSLYCVTCNEIVINLTSYKHHHQPWVLMLIKITEMILTLPLVNLAAYWALYQVSENNHITGNEWLLNLVSFKTLNMCLSCYQPLTGTSTPPYQLTFSQILPTIITVQYAPMVYTSTVPHTDYWLPTYNSFDFFHVNHYLLLLLLPLHGPTCHPNYCISSSYKYWYFKTIYSVSFVSHSQFCRDQSLISFLYLCFFNSPVTTSTLGTWY